MKAYFSGHKDSARINEYLNSQPEDSADFQVVYRLRKMGEVFVEGTLTLREVEDCKELLEDVSGDAESFIREMKCHTFFSALRSIASRKSPLNPFEERVKREIEHPTFCKPVPTGRFPLVIYKLERIWYTRWKHPLVFDEYWLPALVTWVWSVVRWERIVKD